MAYRHHMGCPHPRFEPTPLLSISVRCRWPAYCTIVVLPCRPGMGTSRPPMEGSRHLSESWSIHNQGTCGNHSHGWSKRRECIRGWFSFLLLSYMEMNSCVRSDRYCSSPACLLRADLFVALSVVSGYVHPAHRFLHRWCCSSLLSGPT
jgi:hypothetical protein